jgi:hypothetical protein
MKPPIFIYEPVDLLVFRDVDTACRYLEPPDVARGVGKAFDSEGKPLTVRLVEREQIVIEESDEMPLPDELKNILVTFLSHPKPAAHLGTSAEVLARLSLESLMQSAFQFEQK